MQILSEKAQEEFLRAKSYFEYADSHPTTQTWRSTASEDYGFYDGTGQWEEHILHQMRMRGQSAVTVNKIKNLVNHLSGVEIQTRFRIAFRSHSTNPEEEKLSKALTHLSYYIQESQDIPHKASLKFKDSLITGIGWSNIFKDKDQICYEYVNPFNVLFDPDDLSPELTEMDFVVRLRWLPLREARQRWSKFKDYFDSLFSSNKNTRYASSGAFSGELAMRLQNYVDVYASGDGGTGSRVLVVEVQYKRQKKAFQGVDLKGNTFKTFNEKEALSLSEDGTLEEVDATQVMRVLFSGSILLEYEPLKPSLPDLSDFTYIPSVWSRKFHDGAPDSWISVIKDLQRESNHRRAKLINNLSSFRAEVDADAFPGKSLEEIREQIKSPDSVLIKTPGSIVNIESNMPLAQGQFEMLRRTDEEIQQVSGIYDDSLGKPTNAKTAPAIESRQVQSVRNQVFAFDNLKLMKKREARMLLNLLQGGGDFFLAAHILDKDEEETIILNYAREIDGKQVIFNDMRTLPLSIYVEEVPDFESSAEEQQSNLTALLGNAHAPMIMQSPLFLKKLGFRDYEELAKEMSRLNQQQAQLENPQAESTVSRV